jgi:predicted RNase H-like nuclease
VHQFQPENGRPAGVDGCRGGWVVALDGAPPEVVVVPSFAEVLALTDGPVAVDMPIGLPDEGRRACDSAARQALGPRRSSVFPVPVRSALAATSFAEVTGLSIQAWNIVPKIAEVDACWQANVFEVSPELSLAVVSGAPMAFPKRLPEGRAERVAVLEAHVPGFVRTAMGAAGHDVLDAHACLLTARRIAAGEALTYGDDTRDSRGRPMKVWA